MPKQGTNAGFGSYIYPMDMHIGKIRIGSLALLGIAVFLIVFALCTANAQAPAAGQSSAGQDAQKPLPDVATLIHQVQMQQRASWKTMQHYTYRSKFTEQDLDSHEKVKKTTSDEIENLCYDVACFGRAVSLDGKPLSDEALKKENDAIDKKLAEIRERKAQSNAGRPPAQQKKNSDYCGSYENCLWHFLEVGPQLGTFSNVRRTELHGRPMIAVDYMGNPHAKANTMLDGVFRNLAGTVWVDEQDHALVRIEGKVFADYKVGGGMLADIHKGATLQMEWIKVNDEVWLPLVFNGRGSARILLFSSHSAQIDQSWSDYRKFRVSSAILPVAAEVPDATKAAAPAPAKP
jgi:hypothetical protein